MTEAIEVKKDSGTLVTQGDAPYQKTPTCTREFFLRPPDWRYQTAVTYLNDEENKKTPVIPTDPVVQFVIRALRGYSKPDSRIYIDIGWPRIMEVLRLGTTAKRSAIVSEIESCIIRGKTARDLYNAGFYMDIAVYEMYEKVFFDLSGITAVHAWVNDFLFEPERHQSNSVLLRSRVLAYYGDDDSGMRSSVLGMPEKEDKELMKNLMKTERQKKVFDYITKAVHMDTQSYVDIMEAAVKSMTDQDFQEHMRDRAEQGSSSLEDLAQHLEQGIRAFSQQELQQTNQTGLDFVNQYTATILKKDSDDGKNSFSA